MLKKFNRTEYILIAVLSIAFVLRIVLAYLYYGYPNDIVCFKSWAYLLFSDGLSNFYSSPHFTDYPPGYMYTLYILGAIRHVFNIPVESDLFTVIIKLPAIISDIAIGFFIYWYAKKKVKFEYAVCLAAVYLFNPAIIINSAVWGQVDAIYTAFIVVSIYFLTKKLLFTGFLLFTFAIIIKPQALIFSPVYLYYLYDALRRKNFGKNMIVYIIKSSVICISILLLVMLPFTQRFNLIPIFEQYINTLASYPYASVNAYNLYTALGANWMPIENKLLFMSYGTWGYLFIFLIVIASFYLLYRKKNYFFVAALINFSTFMLSAKMHERYVFPSLVLFLISFIYNKSKISIVIYAILSFTLFVNCRDVLYLIENGNNLNLIAWSSLLISLVNMALFIFTVVFTIKEVVSDIE